MAASERPRALERVFRTVNERLRHRMNQLSVTGHAPVVCECSDPSCTQVLELTPDDYAAVRNSPDRYVVASGHARAELESVVERRKGFDIVEKAAA